jgi:formiminoglutamase
VVSGDVEVDQQLLGETLGSYVEQGSFAIVLGGGHETSYGHFLGSTYGGRPVEILNWDAHPDVRELADGRAHSGSPFRQVIEDPSGACRKYSVAGLQPHAVAQAHIEYVQRHGRAIWRHQVQRL